MSARIAEIVRVSERRGLARLPVLEAAAWQAALAVASRIRFGCLTVVEPDGRRRVYGDPSSDLKAEIRVHDRAAARRIILHGEIGAGEAYMDGQWSSPDLAALLSLAALNRESMDLGGGPWHRLTQLPRTLLHRSRRNTVSGSRRNIAAHYDLGNDFYRLFLD
jgi:cyclopropane-fatty-acyl-phospholipid synthase